MRVALVSMVAFVSFILGILTCCFFDSPHSQSDRTETPIETPRDATPSSTISPAIRISDIPPLPVAIQDSSGEEIQSLKEKLASLEKENKSLSIDARRARMWLGSRSFTFLQNHPGFMAIQSMPPGPKSIERNTLQKELCNFLNYECPIVLTAQDDCQKLAERVSIYHADQMQLRMKYEARGMDNPGIVQEYAQFKDELERVFLQDLTVLLGEERVAFYGKLPDTPR